MYLDPVMIDDLTDLTNPLDLDDADLPGVLQLLENAAELAVPSLLGWKLHLTIQGQPMRLTSIHPCVDTGDVCASLQVDLASVPSRIADSRVTLYADEPDAFTMLAADLAAQLDLSPGRLSLDQDLEPDLTSGRTGLRELSVMNQAIGVLVERGFTIASAQAQVHRRTAVRDPNGHQTPGDPMSNF